jgi:enoyl-[acyl-carrier protein] reductase I
MTDEPPFPTGALMKGKRGLIMGVANKNSIAWSIAQQLHAQGAEIAFTFLNEAMERRVRPLAESLGAKLILECDVLDDLHMEKTFATIEKEWGRIDFLVHSIAFTDKAALEGSFVANTSRQNFKDTMDVSAFSFVDAAHRASKLMPNGGAMVTLTYLGSERTIPNYNVMGVAKAALEASMRYIARDLGPAGIRVNAISAGPIKTLAAAGHRPQGRRGRGALPSFGPWRLLHRRDAACRRRLPYRRHAGRGRPEGGLVKLRKACAFVIDP